MGIYTTRRFWAGAAERAVKTFAQSLLALIAVGTPIFGQDWAQFLGISATATLISVLTSIATPTTASAGEGESGVDRG